jgi:hypothetical protein
VYVPHLSSSIIQHTPAAAMVLYYMGVTAAMSDIHLSLLLLVLL